MADYITVPNQRTVKITREPVKTDFLGIKNENWKSACRDLRPHAFVLYLYLASNANGYQLALSPEAIRREIGMARSTYHDQFKILIDKGYLVQTGGNTYTFYEIPRPSAENQEQDLKSPATAGRDFENDTIDGQPIPSAVQNGSGEDIEINIDSSINNAINSEELPKENQVQEQVIPTQGVKVITIKEPQLEPKVKLTPKPECKTTTIFDF